LKYARILCFATLLWLTPAVAEAASIAIVRPSDSAPASVEALHRLQGELFALGFPVALLDRRAAGEASALDSRDDLGRMAAERGIDALIDVVGDENPPAVEIWIVDPASHRYEVSRVVLEPNTPNAAETLAIRAIEVLRSNFVEIDLAARARSEPPPAPPPARDATPRPVASSERFDLEAGIAVLGSLDGVGPALLPLVRFGFSPSSWLVVEASLAGLGTRPTIETALGTATVSQNYGLVGVSYSPLVGSVRPYLSLSAGALQTSLEGQADSPQEGHDVTQWSFLFDAGLGARFLLSDRYYFSPSFHVALAEPYVAVHFVDQEVARSGQPNLVGSLTFGAWL
jgi:hypothetical protein